MTMLAQLNHLDSVQAEAEFQRCCGSSRWARQMAQARPFSDVSAVYAQADRIWAALSSDDWLEAFTHHPRIGDLHSLRAQEEQRGVRGSSEELLRSLAAGNQAYEARFGHVFLVCATGKTAAQMLALLNERIGNAPAVELRVAAGEQHKITRLRLEKLLNP